MEPIDTAKWVPLTLGVTVVLGAMSVLHIYADIVRPISLRSPAEPRRCRSGVCTELRRLLARGVAALEVDQDDVGTPSSMRAMSIIERVTVDPAVAHGRPVVRGTRMRVSDILSLLAAGAPEDEILQDYPYLAREDIRAALEYAALQHDHAILLTS